MSALKFQVAWACFTRLLIPDWCCAGKQPWATACQTSGCWSQGATVPQTSVELDPLGLKATYANITLMLLKWLLYTRTQRYALQVACSARTAKMIMLQRHSHVCITSIRKSPPPLVLTSYYVLNTQSFHKLLQSCWRNNYLQSPNKKKDSFLMHLHLIPNSMCKNCIIWTLNETSSVRVNQLDVFNVYVVNVQWLQFPWTLELWFVNLV